MGVDWARFWALHPSFWYFVANTPFSLKPKTHRIDLLEPNCCREATQGVFLHQIWEKRAKRDEYGHESVWSVSLRRISKEENVKEAVGARKRGVGCSTRQNSGDLTPETGAAAISYPLGQLRCPSLRLIDSGAVPGVFFNDIRPIRATVRAGRGPVGAGRGTAAPPWFQWTDPKNKSAPRENFLKSQNFGAFPPRDFLPFLLLPARSAAPPGKMVFLGQSLATFGYLELGSLNRCAHNHFARFLHSGVVDCPIPPSAGASYGL